VFLVGTFQLIRQQYNVVTNGVSVGNIPTQTSKDSGMDSWMECRKEIILRGHKGQGRLQYLGYIRASSITTESGAE